MAEYIVKPYNDDDEETIIREWHPEELIRCKDCKYGKYDKINRKYQCEKIRQRTWFIIWHDGDFFCKDGDPKDGEHE